MDFLNLNNEDSLSSIKKQMIQEARIARFVNLIKMLPVAATYVMLTQLSIAYAPSGFVTVVWPASGFALATLLIYGNRYVCGIFLGAVISYSLSGKPLGLTLAISMGNSLEALAGAWLLSEQNSKKISFNSVSNYLNLVKSAGIIACSIAAIIGATSLLLAGVIDYPDFINTLFHWWMGDALGIILIAPVILTWQVLPAERLKLERLIEIILVFGLTFLVGQIVFNDLFRANIGRIANNYWLFLCISWIAIRFGVHGTVIMLLMTSAQALHGAYHGIGYFANDIADTGLVNYWFYMVILSGVGMILSTYFAEIKIAKQALHKNEKIAQQALNDLSSQKYALDQHAIVEIIDTLGNIKYVNDKFCQISGFSRAETLGYNYQKFDSEQHPPGFFKAISGIISQGQVWHGEICNRSKNGQLYWLDTTVIPFLDEFGKPREYIAIHTDITERKCAETALKAGERILREAQEAARIGHYSIDIKNLTWQSSPVLDDIFGIDTHFEKSIDHWAGLIDPDCKEEVFNCYFNAFNEKKRVDQIYKIIRHNDKEARWVSMLGECDYDEHGNILRVIGTIQDVTERKLAELELEHHRDNLQEMVQDRTLQLEQAKELAEQANQAKSAFLSNMSHEFRTPIHAILSFGELGLEKAQNPNCDLSKLKQYFGYIVQSGKRLLPLLNDLLDLSKLEAGKMIFTMTPCSLYPLTLEIVNEISILSTQKNIHIDTENVLKDLTIHCDVAKIAQVLRNLIANAIKFSPENSTITLQTALTDLKGRRAGDNAKRPAIVFDVIDQGIGIPENELNIIFDQFVQSSKTNTRAGGTGLGLSISREIIKGHQGIITAFNNPDAGSRFSFTIPISPYDRKSK